MNINPKSAFVLLYKLRECMGETIKNGGDLSGEVEVDGAYVGGSARQENRKSDRRSRRDETRRSVVVVARERGGSAVPWVVAKESDAVSLIRARVATDTTIHAWLDGSLTVDRLSLLALNKGAA